MSQDRCHTDTAQTAKEGVFVNPDFRYVADDYSYICPASEALLLRYVAKELVHVQAQKLV